MSREYKWNFSNRKQPSAEDLLWLYRSFVLDCPVPGVSCRAKTFADRGLTGRSLFELQRSMKNKSSLSTSSWRSIPYPSDRKKTTKRESGSAEAESLESVLNACGISEKYRLGSEFAYYYNAKDSKTAGLFYLIRNALAHGSFAYHETNTGGWIALETRRNGKLRGRSLLKMKTLRNWREMLLHPNQFVKER